MTDHFKMTFCQILLDGRLDIALFPLLSPVLFSPFSRTFNRHQCFDRSTTYAANEGDVQYFRNYMLIHTLKSLIQKYEHIYDTRRLVNPLVFRCKGISYDRVGQTFWWEGSITGLLKGRIF